MEYPWTHFALPPQRFSDCPLRFQNLSKFGSKGKLSSLIVLGGSWIQAHAPGSEVHLTKLEHQNLTRNSPARDVGEGNHLTKIRVEMLKDSFKILALEETPSNIVLLEHRYAGSGEKLPAFNRKRERAFQGRQLTVDFLLSSSDRLALHDEPIHRCCCDCRGTLIAKGRQEMPPEPHLKVFERPPSDDPIFVRAEIVTWITDLS